MEDDEALQESRKLKMSWCGFGESARELSVTSFSWTWNWNCCRREKCRLLDGCRREKCRLLDGKSRDYSFGELVMICSVVRKSC